MRGYLLSIVAVCMLTVLANGLVHQGSLQRIVRFGGGLLVLLVVARPLPGLDLQALARQLEQGAGSRGFDAAQAAESAQEQFAQHVRTTTESYIESYAAQLGAAVQATVYLTREEYPRPLGAQIRGLLTPAQHRQLEEYLLQSLGMDPQEVEWKLNE